MKKSVEVALLLKIGGTDLQIFFFHFLLFFIHKLLITEQDENKVIVKTLGSMEAKFFNKFHLLLDSVEFKGVVLHEPNVRTRRDEEDVDVEAEDEHYKLFIWLDDYVQSLTDNVYSNDDIR